MSNNPLKNNFLPVKRACLRVLSNPPPVFLNKRYEQFIVQNE